MTNRPHASTSNESGTDDLAATLLVVFTITPHPLKITLLLFPLNIRGAGIRFALLLQPFRKR